MWVFLELKKGFGRGHDRGQDRGQVRGQGMTGQDRTGHMT